MEKRINIQAKGLYSYPNEYSAVPESGTLTVANNVEIRREGVVESRRGFATIDATLSSRPSQVIDFKTYVLAHYGSTLAYYNKTNAFVNYTGTVDPADVTLGRLKSKQSNNNLYALSATGVLKLESATGDLSTAGIPKALDIQASLHGTSGFLADTKLVAYRHLWGIKDTNGNLILGAVSQREVIQNTAGSSDTRDVDLTFSIPDGITTSHFYQIYRTAQFDTGVDPDDECQLVLEANPSSGDLTAGYVTVTDSLDDALRGATIYTAQSQQGILKNNERPPLSKCIETFRGYTFLGNTQSVQRLYSTVISAANFTANDTVVIGGVTYTADTAEDTSTGHFAIATGGSVSQNIRDTTLSLIRCINRSATNTTVYAYYISGVDDLPGKILVEGRTVAVAAFTIQSTNAGDAFSPDCTDAQTSSKDTMKNGLFYSKFQQPESFPLLQYYQIGNGSDDILALKANRDSLFIFKTDGIFRLVGFSEDNFRIEQFDTTSVLLAPDSVSNLNNQIYYLSTQGVCRVSDTGVELLSLPIENIFQELYGASAANMRRYPFGMGYESDRKYVLFVPSSGTETVPSQAYVYNYITNAWTRWTVTASCGIVNPADDLIYIGRATSISKERKAYTFQDFIDESTDVTILSQPTTTSVVLASVNGLSVGDLLYEAANKYSVITNITNTTLTLDNAVVWTVGAAKVYAGINCVVEWNNEACGDIYSNKHFREVLLPFKNSFFVTAKIGFFTNLSSYFEYQSISGTGIGGWGSFPFGSLPWGNNVTSDSFRAFVPRNKRRAQWLRNRFEVRSAYSRFQLDGIGIVFNRMNERVKK